MDPKIVIKDETFMLDFSMKAFRSLGKKWEMKSIAEVMAKIATLENAGEQMDFDFLDMVAEILVNFANSSNGNPRQINEDDILSLRLDDLMKLVSSFSASMIESVQTDNPLTLEEQGKKKPKKAAAQK